MTCVYVLQHFPPLDITFTVRFSIPGPLVGPLAVGRNCCRKFKKSTREHSGQGLSQGVFLGGFDIYYHSSFDWDRFYGDLV